MANRQSPTPQDPHQHPNRPQKPTSRRLQTPLTLGRIILTAAQLAQLAHHLPHHHCS